MFSVELVFIFQNQACNLVKAMDNQGIYMHMPHIILSTLLEFYQANEEAHDIDISVISTTDERIYKTKWVSERSNSITPPPSKYVEILYYSYKLTCM
jgi:hypothetical protein